MSFQYHTLRSIPLADIAAAFNQSFADYAAPLSITPQRLAEKIRAEGIDLDLSMGVFDGAKIIGFVWHSTRVINGKEIAYNGGTGVIPEYRGRHLVREMYRFIQPYFKQRDISGCTLEVITNNIPAVKAYEGLGFRAKRTLNVYKGVLKGECVHVVKEMTSLNFLDVTQFWDCEPAWQHTVAAINLAIEENKIVAIEKDGVVVAYAVFYPVISRLKQLAVHKDYRRQGMATSLLQYLQQQYGEFTCANIDEGCISINQLLLQRGMSNTIQQYEMWKEGIDF
ncbi:MAG: GNAT family N-acetyltransferase [Flavipsychrobacter sp.]